MDERQAELLVERLIRRIEQANIYFLNKIGSSIKKIRELTPTQAQQLVQILKYGGTYEDIIRQIAKYTNLNIKDIDEIFSSYAKKDQQFYKQFYQYRNIPFVPFEENTALKMQTKALSNIVKNEMYNFTRNNVLGYTIRDLKGKVQFLGLRETYNRVLDEALLNVGQGKETFDDAMNKIMTDIGGSGLKTIEYESGRSIRLDSAVRMHLKSRLRELHNENQQLFGEEFGADGVEVSVHLNPADDHAEVQGKQFTIEEYRKLQTTGVAKDVKGRIIDITTKYGFRPISELNCYHYVFSIIVGVSKPEYDDKQLKQIMKTNDKGFKFEGKHYSLYDGQQLLRKVELELRKSKDIQILARSSNNIELVEKMQNRITQLTNKYKDILKASGLKSKLERAKIAGYHRININKIK